MELDPSTAIDFYKSDHRRQYPDGTTQVYSNFTPRHSRMDGVKEIIFFGLQYLIKDYLLKEWQKEFFNMPKNQVVDEYKLFMDSTLGIGVIEKKHIEALHDLGYLPIKIKALPEGSLVPMGVPVLTIVNTLPEFFWLTNYLETILSCYLWSPSTCATIAYEYRKLLTQFAVKTGSSFDFINFQAHDFSFRGKSSPQSASADGAGHLLSFLGTDTAPAIQFLRKYYNADFTKEFIGGSVIATEHAVMSMGGKETELETYRRLITTVYPKGILSIVSDTWDFWKVITEYLPILKSEIMARDGKVVIRPDSGDPVKIICGDPEAEKYSPAYKGAVRCLWEIFGGTTDKGYSHLDPHIGLIYGDSITLERAQAILSRLAEQGFASDNIVFGIGSYTYQYITRDTFGWAMKATSGIVNGEHRDIFKNPVTDCGIKKSAKGLLRVEKENDQYVLYESQTSEQEAQGCLETVFENGTLIKETNLAEIRRKLGKLGLYFDYQHKNIV